jgi:hypothetical protein
MKLITSSLMFLISLTLIAPSCKKAANNNPGLPPATQKGSNTMGARINGVIWVKGACISCIGGQTGLSVTGNNGTFRIYGEAPNSSGGKTSIIFFMRGVTHTGDYPLTKDVLNSSTVSDGELSIDKDNTTLIYKTDDTHLGTVTITKLDPSNHIVSGVFSFDAINQKDINDTTHITEGRFDAIYQD